MTDFTVIDFDPEGGASAMHRDQFPLGFLGKQSISRASEITFNEDTQLWSILLNRPTLGYCHVEDATGFLTYEIARKVEVDWLELSSLNNYDPLSTEGISILRQVKESYATQ